MFDEFPYLIEYRYKGQLTCKSYHKCKSLAEVIDWVVRFKNLTLEDHTAPQDIEELRITLQELPIVKWIQVHRKGLKYWNDFDIVLIINDYPLGQIYTYNDLISFLQFFIKE